jgi:AAA+ ATPase superfamily predicted ATPase
MWQLVGHEKLNFNKLGRWWNNKEEIDIVGFDSGGEDIVFGECKYKNTPTDIDVLYSLVKKTEHVIWKNEKRKEKFILFSISGFSDRLCALAEERDDLILLGRRRTS